MQEANKISKINNSSAFIMLGITLFFGAGTYGIKAIVNGLGMAQKQSEASFLIYILWAVFLIRFLYQNKNMVSKILLYETIYIGIMFINYISFPITRDYYIEYEMYLRQIIVVYIPSMAIAASISDFSGCIEKLKQFSMLALIFMTISYALGYSSLFGGQFFGVQISPFVIILLANYLLYKKKQDLFFTLFGLFFIFLGGRQSLIGIIMGGGLLYYIISIKHFNKHRIWIFIIVLAPILFLLYLLFPNIIDLLAKTIDSFGYHSRTISMLQNSKLFDTSSRELIYSTAVDYIKNNAFAIEGLFGDRYYIRFYESYIVYPHNLILELMMDFGFFLGGIISAIIFISFFKSLRAGDKNKKIILSSVGSVVLCRLFVSSSFMIEGLFYTLIGLIINSQKKLKHIKRIN